MASDGPVVRKLMATILKTKWMLAEKREREKEIKSICADWFTLWSAGIIAPAGPVSGKR